MGLCEVVGLGFGFHICEADSAEALYEGSAPWSGATLDYDAVNIAELTPASAQLTAS